MTFKVFSFLTFYFGHKTLQIESSFAWTDQLHEEIWVYDQASLNIMLSGKISRRQTEKTSSKKMHSKMLYRRMDVYSFFVSETIYKELGIP